MSQHLNSEELLPRLEASTFKHPNGCWLWQGSRTKKGYGQIKVGFSILYVHRVSAHLYHGMDLDDTTLQATHSMLCPNKNCWNPIHIEVASAQKNSMDNVDLGKWRNQYGEKDKTHCINGHLMVGDNRLETGGRVKCRECQRRSARESVQRKRQQQRATTTPTQE